MIWSIILGWLLAIVALAWGQEPAVPVGSVVTLEQAITLALHNNRQVKNAALEVDKAADRVAQAQTRRLPALEVQVLESYLLTPIDFTFKQGTFGTFPGTGPIPAKDTTIRTERKPTTIVAARVTQPLSQLYRIGMNVGLQEAGGAMAQAQLRQQRQAVVHDVKQAYYGILQTLSGLDAIEESLKSYRELDRLVANYVVQQKALKADHLDVQTRLAKADYDALTLRHALATQQEQLNFLLGLDVQTTFQVSPVSETVVYAEDAEAASRRAVTQRPELQQAQLKVKQAEYDRRMKQAEYIPDVSLAFSYLSPFNVEFVPHNIASVGVLLSWELFDWGRKHREIAEKRKTERQAINTVSDTEMSVQLEVRSKLRTLQEKAALLRVEQLAQETTIEKLRVMMQKYTQQAALLQDVLQAQADLARANADYRQGLAAFWTARADFEKALGEE